MKIKIVIIMSTYNGESFLKEQLESILSQSNKNIDLFIRDDGSTDATRNILEQYSGKENIQIKYGENIGFAQSFLKMIKHVAFDYDYIMFSDQDDVWEEGKVDAFVECMMELDHSVPVLYFCGYEVVNQDLEHISFSPSPRVINFESALVQNIVTGCTCGMNAAASRMIVEKLPNPNIKLHDWWAYLVVSAFGKVYFDRKILIKYRQHGGNTIVASVGTCGLLKKVERKILNLLAGNRTMDRLVYQAELFRNMYKNEMDENILQKLDSFIESRFSMAQRLKWAICPRPLRQRLSEDLFLRMAFLFWL